MKTLVLDCTLRDGGYCNNWRFGFNNAKKVVQSLVDSGVEVVECGFLTNRIEYNEDVTKYTCLSQAEAILPKARMDRKFVLMANFGEYDFNTLPERTNGSIDGIRVAFHKKNIHDALKQTEIIKSKGYDLFLQPMVSLSYTDSEFLELISLSNKLHPYAFYIVDSFGTMKRRDLEHLFYMVDYNLDKDIIVGFHSHNNMQLAYANAQTLIDIHSSHDLIIDSSIYGMGRGAGNLNTELFLDYLNDNLEKKYAIRPLINVIDDVLDGFYKLNYWGYSLPNYLSASYNTHPNYAGFLSDKNTLNVEDMDAILGMMDSEKRVYFDKDYIEKIYLKYLSSGKVFEQHKNEFEEQVKGKTVLLIAPGKSSFEEREQIIECAKKDGVIVISINHNYQYYNPSFIFLSNLRRYRELDSCYYPKCIVTSNIPTTDAYMQTDYRELLNDNTYVKDNAGLMAIKFLINSGVNEIILAGFDGYSHDASENYSNQSLLLVTKNAMVDAMNIGMSEILSSFADSNRLGFLTSQKYVNISCDLGSNVYC